MSTEGDLSDRVMNYLDGNMSNNELLDFEKECKTNPELKEMVGTMKAMDVVLNDDSWYIIDKNSEEVKAVSPLFREESLESFSKKVKASEKRYRNNNGLKSLLKYVSGIAAILLITFGVKYYIGFNTPSDELFDTYYNTRDLPSFTLKNDNTSTIIKAEALFKEGNYTDALELFDLITGDESKNPGIYIYKALCYLNLKQYDDALKYLDLLEKSNTIDYHKAYWFKTLLYLKQDKKESAIKSLNKLLENKNNFNYQKALKLYDQLK